MFAFWLALGRAVTSAFSGLEELTDAENVSFEKGKVERSIREKTTRLNPKGLHQSLLAVLLRRCRPVRPAVIRDGRLKGQNSRVRLEESFFVNPRITVKLMSFELAVPAAQRSRSYCARREGLERHQRCDGGRLRAAPYADDVPGRQLRD